MSKLYAARFENNDTSAALLEQFGEVEAAGVDWSVYDFGVTRIEATVKANGPYDAFARYDSQLGQRFALYGSDLYRPISGWIYEVEWLPGDRIRYVAYGVNWRMEDKYMVRRFDRTDSISDAIEYIAGLIKIDNGATGDIVSNATTLDGWNPTYPQGSYPTDAIRELLAMSDSSSRIYDFRYIDEPLSTTNLQQFEPHYTYRDSTASANWVVSRADLSRLKLSRNIGDFANIVRVWYGTVEGQCTAQTATTMTNASATFITHGVQPGDTITNVTQGGRTKIISVDSQTQVTHEGWRAKARGTFTSDGGGTSGIDADADFINDGVSAAGTDTLKNLTDSSTGTIDGVTATTLTISGGMGGTNNDSGERYEITANMAVNDLYSIRTQAQTRFEEYVIDKGDLWEKEIAVFERSMDAGQAAQYAEALATVTPQQVQSFVISSPFVENGNGARVPLWDVVSNGGGYIQVKDLYPAAAQFTDALNSLTTFWITGMSYDYTTNSLTVDVDNLSRRLDARLRRAQILRVPQIRRY